MRFFDKTRDTVDAICLAVCLHFNADVRIVRSKSRQRPISRIRKIVMYVIRQITELSHHQIGRILGRDHSTIVTGSQDIKAELEFDPFLRRGVEACLEKARAALALLDAPATAL